MKEPQFSFDVFLSHNSKDKPRVRMLAERLRSAGLRVWFDEWIIQPGDDIYLTIEGGLEVSRTLILCLSDNAIGSDWVGLERSTALFRDPSNAARRFIPLLLADCELPDTLRRYKYIDFRVESDEAFQKLLAACRPECVDVSTRAMRPYPNARDHVPTLNATLGPDPGIRYYFDRWFPRLHWALTRTGVLSKPAELAVINNYLRELRSQIKNEFHEKTYLPLAGKPLAPVSPITQAIDRDPFVSPIHQVILQIMGQSYGGDSASAQIAATSRQSRVVRNILKHLDHAQAPLILLGEPGSGKTMTMQQSTLLLAERESHQVFPKIPIYVRLGEFFVTGKVDSHDVWDYVKRSVDSSLSHYLDGFEREGRLVIFFDGMDEMSRERYGEHTEALSIFAAWSASQSLFSCRITDFSPRFLHQRLVILPFDRSQVSEYLHKYIEQFPLRIDGRLWSLKQLTKQIIQGELPIEANNPFVLWLLCLYLQDKQAWPKSRVEMLRYYNESNYQRKNKELPNDEPRFPKREEAFSAWARFAYLTTERNRGPAMPVHLLEADQDGARIEEMIRVGKRCGVLAESREQFGEHLIRFQHHRFQEFFTALHIHQHRPSIEWLDKFDAPRWQETMLNLILMGGADDVVQTFVDSVESLTQACQAEVDGQKNASDKRENQEITLTDQQQTMLADRVEVSSRILHQIGSGMSDVRKKLMMPFRAAVGLLADHGNPITQVKMMRACQNVQAIDFIEALKKPLNSSINWVRNQALLLIVGNQASSRAIGSDMATEIGYDLANGNFPKRLPTYWKAACTSNNSENWWVFLAGSFCYVAYVLSLLAVSGLLYWGMWGLGDARWIGLPDFTYLGNPISYYAFLIILIILMATAFIVGNRLEVMIPSIAMILVFLIPVIYNLWQGLWKEFLLFLLLFSFGGFIFVMAVSLITMSLPCEMVKLISYTSAIIYSRHDSKLFNKNIISAWKMDNDIKNIPFGLLVIIAYISIWVFGWWFKANKPWLEDISLVGYIIRNSHLVHPFFDGIIGLFDIFVIACIYIGVPLIVIVGLIVGLIEAVKLLYKFLNKCDWKKVIFWFLAYIGITGIIYLGIILLNIRPSNAAKLTMFIELGICVFVLGILLISQFLFRGFYKNIGLFKVYLKNKWIKWILIIIVIDTAFASLISVTSYFYGTDPETVIEIAHNAITKDLLIEIASFLVYYICILLLTVIVAVLLILILRPWFFSLRRRFFGKRIHLLGKIDSEHWKMDIQNAKAENQNNLLLRTNYKTLSLKDVSQFVEILKEIQPWIKEEPALSTYWELRYRLEEALRQERQG
ncbi:MAG: TIR domain-containing protein [Proteobacteria bacterium]|nr:TIR domain-containing protein [Pseudomonadota bacterium]